MRTLSSKNLNAWHCENLPWKNLFGLLFWDIIFSKQAKVIHHPYQTSPSDLTDKRFFDSRKDSIERRCEELLSLEVVSSILDTHLREHWSKPNPFVSWYGRFEDQAVRSDCFQVLSLVGSNKVAAVLKKISINPRAHCSGFPDLLIWSGGEYEFIEIKSETDSLSYKQQSWLAEFRLLEINSSVLRIRWASENCRTV